MVVVSTEAGAATVREVGEARDAERMRGVRAEPLVRSVLERFPGAEIIAVRTIDEPETVSASFLPGGAIADDVVYADTEIGDGSDDDI
jgi:DNA polymerase-3 subunit gamma/tau